jgi:tyrosine-protein kinase Etk/Wzc
VNDKERKDHSNKLIESKDLIFIWRLILKNLWLILLLPALAYLIGFVYTYRLSNVYGAKAELLLKSNETYDYQDPIYQGLGAYGVYMDVQNQMRILNSRDLISEVIDKLNFQTSYYVVGRLKKVEVYETLPFKSEVTVTNRVINEVPITVVVSDIDNYIASFELNGDFYSYNGQFDSLLVTDYFQLTLYGQYKFNEENIGDIKSSNYEIVFHSKDYLIKKYQTSLSVENIEHTSVLELVVSDGLALRGRDYLDTLAHTYVDYSKEIQLEVNENTTVNIQKQIDTVSVLISQKERELLVYKDENSILNIAKEEEDYFGDYVEYTRIKRELEQKKSSVDLLMTYLNSSDDNRVLPPTFYIEKNDYYLSETLNNVRKKQVAYEMDKAKKSAENITMQKAQKEILLLINDVKVYLKNLDLAIQTEIDQTEKYIAEYRRDVKRMPKSAQGILNIQRELDVNNKMYLFLLEKMTNTLIARAGIIPQVRIIENTVSTGILYPNKEKIIRLFILGGFMLALVIAIIRKIFFEKIENVEHLKEVSDMHVIGGIPFVKSLNAPIMVEAQPKSQVTESFRTVRTNLSYMGENKPGVRAKKVMLSSFFPGEGKTFCSSNISHLVAKGDKKVLLIDFDLHRPKVHKMYDLKNTIGVSNYIIGKNTLAEVIRKDINENLDIITAGPIAPNPSELLLRDRVSELIKEVENSYDLVIFDTPPFGLLNDTNELVKYIDVFIVVMNTQYTRKSGVLKIAEMMSRFDDKVSIGFILNGIKQNKFQYYYSKYTYTSTAIPTITIMATVMEMNTRKKISSWLKLFPIFFGLCCNFSIHAQTILKSGFNSFSSATVEPDVNIIAGQLKIEFIATSLQIYEGYLPLQYSLLSLDEFERASLQIAPNPTNGLLYVSNAQIDSHAGCNFVIRSMSGKEVIHGKLFTGQNTIDLSLLSNGIYILSYRLNDNITRSEKIVKI